MVHLNTAPKCSFWQTTVNPGCLEFLLFSFEELAFCGGQGSRRKWRQIPTEMRLKPIFTHTNFRLDTVKPLWAFLLPSLGPSAVLCLSAHWAWVCTWGKSSLVGPKSLPGVRAPWSGPVQLFLEHLVSEPAPFPCHYPWQKSQGTSALTLSLGSEMTSDFGPELASLPLHSEFSNLEDFFHLNFHLSFVSKRT